MNRQSEICNPKSEIPEIRWMIRRDMPEVLAIERASFVKPWTAETFAGQLSQANCVALVAERGEQIVGWVVYSLGKDRIRVQRLAVAPECRRQGVGRALIRRLQCKLCPKRRRLLEAWGHEQNDQGPPFLLACGWIAAGLERGACDDGRRDAYRFVYRHGWPKEGPVLTPERDSE